MPRISHLQTLRPHTAPCWSAAFSASGLLATASADRTITIWQTTPTITLIAKYASPTTFLRTIRSLAFSPDSRSLAVASFDATATILELLGGKEPKLDPVVCLEGHESEVKCCAYSSSGGLLATCSRDRSVWIWEVGLDFEYDCVGVLNGHSGDVKRVTWHPEKELLLSCSYDETIRVWAEDEDDWFCIETLTAHGHTVCDVSFDRIGEKFVSCDAGGEIIIWARGMCADGDVRYRVVTRMNVCEEGVISVHWGSDGIVAGCADDCVRVLDIVEEKLQVSASVERAHVGEVNCVRWSPVQKDVFVSTGDDGCVRIWRYESEPQEDGDRGGALQR